jgi:hypothetical protein
MTDNTPVLRARTAPAAVPTSTDKLQLQMQLAKLIARGGPEAQAFLTVSFAEQRGLDLLTCTQGVNFVRGRPVIDATLQRALAKRAGYRVRVTVATTTSATVEVSEGDELLGTATYTLDDARAAGLAEKDNWKQNPKAMLVARATTQAMRWFAPDVMTGLLVEDEADDTDAVAVLAPPTVDTPTADVAEHIDTPASAAEDDITDAEVVEDAGPADAATRGKAKAAIDGAKGDGSFPVLAEAMQAEGIGLAATKWTQAQALRIVELDETLPGPEAA